MRSRTTIVLALSIIVLLAPLATKSVYAHELRTVAIAGKNTSWLVGWQYEPAYTQVENYVQLFATYNSSGTIVPVNGLDTALKLSVSTGGQSIALSLQRSDDNPTLYFAALFPTAPGTYVFTFTGTVNGTAINQVFTCGPTTFNCIDPLSNIQFPIKQPTPTTLQGSLNSTISQVNSLNSQIATLTLIAALGIGVGVAGLVVAIAAFMTKRRIPSAGSS